MKYECPDYALKFKCKANACTDNCCIGWEIGIDEKTLDFYKNLEGEIGERIRKNLCTGGDCATFKLGDFGRCPMLGKDNLCDVIRTLGEGAICEICREHPRFYNVLDARAEWGVGLSCEAAAELILASDRHKTESGEGEDVMTDGCEWSGLDQTVRMRDEILKFTDESRLSFFKKARAILEFAEAFDSALAASVNELAREEVCGGAKEPDAALVADMLKKLTELDFLDAAFENYVKARVKSIRESGLSAPSPFADLRLCALLRYFIYRHLVNAERGCASSYVRLAIILSLSIYALVKDGENMRDWIDAAKALSKEAEYNEDNLSLLLDMTMTEPEFSASALKYILE